MIDSSKLGNIQFIQICGVGEDLYGLDHQGGVWTQTKLGDEPIENSVGGHRNVFGWRPLSMLIEVKSDVVIPF